MLPAHKRAKWLSRRTLINPACKVPPTPPSLLETGHHFPPVFVHTEWLKGVSVSLAPLPRNAFVFCFPFHVLSLLFQVLMCKTNLCTGTIEFISKQVTLQRTRKGKICVVWLNMKRR